MPIDVADDCDCSASENAFLRAYSPSRLSLITWPAHSANEAGWNSCGRYWLGKTFKVERMSTVLFLMPSHSFYALCLSCSSLTRPRLLLRQQFLPLWLSRPSAHRFSRSTIDSLRIVHDENKTCRLFSCALTLGSREGCKNRSSSVSEYNLL